MTSKVQQKKDEQGYVKSAACCKNCTDFKSDMIEKKYSWSEAVDFEEKNKRCSIGEFAVQSTGYCDFFKRKVASK